MKKIKYNQGIAPIIAIIIGLIIAAGIVGIVATQKKAPVTEEPILAPFEEVAEKAVQQIPGTQLCPPATPPSITVLSPNGGETYNAGDNIVITWETCNIPANTMIEIYAQRIPDPAGSFTFTGTAGTIDDGIETFMIPSSAVSGGYLICMNKAIVGGAPGDCSDNTFTIIASPPPQIQAQQSASECGLIVTSPLSNQTVTFPLIITGTVEAGLIGGCRWGIFEGEAGTVAVYDTNGNKRSDTVILAPIPNWMSPGAHSFTVTIPALTSQPYTNDLNLIFKDNDPRDPPEAEPSQLVIPVSL